MFLYRSNFPDRLIHSAFPFPQNSGFPVLNTPRNMHCAVFIICASCPLVKRRKKCAVFAGQGPQNDAKTKKQMRPAFARRICGLEVPPRFELGNEGFADLCLTTWPRHHMSRNYFLLFFWSGRRGSNSLPPPWQGGALPDELRPHDICSLRRTYKKMVPPIGIEPMTRGFSVPCSTD